MWTRLVESVECGCPFVERPGQTEYGIGVAVPFRSPLLLPCPARPVSTCKKGYRLISFIPVFLSDFYGLSDSGTKVAFLDEQRFAYIADNLEQLGITAIIAKPEKEITTDNAIEFEAAVTKANGATFSEVEMDSEDNALIMYTSGTTGNPKGALSNHRNVCQAIYNFECAGIVAAMTGLSR